MPGGCREHEVVGHAWRRPPLLEIGADHLGVRERRYIRTRDRCQVMPEFDRRDGEAPPRELDGGLARTSSDLQ